MLVKNVEVEFINFEGTLEEAKKYVDYVQARIHAPLSKIVVELCADGKVDVHYFADGQKFERIRRITGYLTGDLKTWNDAKKAEESQRVKHGVNFNAGETLQDLW